MTKWVSRLGKQLTDYEEKVDLLKEYKKKVPSLKLSEVASLGGRRTYSQKRGILQYKSMHLFHLVKDSLIVANIFENLKDQLFEHTRTVDSFDEVSIEKFFKRELKTIYQRLFLEGRDFGPPLT